MGYTPGWWEDREMRRGLGPPLQLGARPPPMCRFPLRADKGVEPFSSLMMDLLVCVYIHTTVTRDKGGSFPKEIER